MKEISLAARYARALFIVTEKRGETAQALEDLTSVGEVLAPGTRVAAFLLAPQVLLADKRKLLSGALEGKCVRSVALFVDLLMRKRRLQGLPTCVSEFRALVERSQGLRRASVVSAVPLAESEQRRLHAELERVTGGKVKLDAEVDPGVLGGVLVRIGDRVFDRTVKTLLESLSRRLYEARV